jgi:hypothetical protein
MPLFIGELGCGSIWRLDVAEKLTAPERQFADATLEPFRAAVYEALCETACKERSGRPFHFLSAIVVQEPVPTVFLR